MARNHAQNLQAPGPESDQPIMFEGEGDALPEDGAVEYDTNQVDVINISSNVVRFEIDGNKYVLKPRQTTKLHKSYALMRKMSADRDPLPSQIELLTSKRVLAITDERARHVYEASRVK